MHSCSAGRIRFFGIGGAKLDPTVELFLLEGRFPYAIGYGLTETAPVLAGVNPSMVRHQSTGPMLEGVEARLDNVNPRSGEGEIVVKGPNVMMGYYKNPEATGRLVLPRTVGSAQKTWGCSTGTVTSISKGALRI